jgi:catechol 2,3-dioxygenase
VFTLDGIDHVAITVRDVLKSVEWYRTVLGLVRVHEEAWGDLPAVVGIGTTAIALFPVKSNSSQTNASPGTLSMRHIAFRADAANYAKAQGELRSQGIQFQQQDHGIARSIYFEDPDGHQLEITTYSSPR